MSTLIESDEADTLEVLLDRVREAIGSDKDADVARALGVNRSAIPTWRKRGTVPWGEFVKFAYANNLSLDWLFTGGPHESYEDGVGSPMGHAPQMPSPEMEAALAIESVLVLDEELARVGVLMDREARAMLALGGWSQVRQEADTEEERSDLLRKLFRMTIGLQAGGLPRRDMATTSSQFEGSQQNFHGKVGQAAGRDIVNKGKKK